jgi:hypothetical protein
MVVTTILISAMNGILISAMNGPGGPTDDGIFSGPIIYGWEFLMLDRDYPDVQLTLRAEADPGAPPPVRLRMALKVLLRRFGFKAVSIQWLDAEPAAAGKNNLTETNDDGTV